jgi:uncharacterized repeat protein (TIGR01451 family)/gliding motility-associated-like protein
MLMNFTKVHSKTSNSLEVLNSSKVSDLTCNQAVSFPKGLEVTPQTSRAEEHYNAHDKQNLTSGSYEHLLSVTEQVSPTSTLFTFIELIEKYTQVNSHMQNPKGMGFKHLQKPLIKYLASTLFLLMSFLTTFGQLPTVDLKLSKSIDDSQPQVGALVIFTMTLQNEGSTDATQITVEDIFPNTGLDYGSGAAESGTWTYDNMTGIGSWVIPRLAAGESITLEVRATVKTEAMGVFFNVAEVKSLNEEDYDSVPDNKKLHEDDIATACFSVPIRWKVGDEYNVSIPPMYEGIANIKWMRNGVAVTSNTSQASVEADGSLSIVGPGSYTFTADLSSCNATGCCALQVVDSTGFDLALRETTVTTSVTPGQNVTFDIKVFNQGNVNATNVMVADYIPTGFTLNDSNWNLIGGVAKLKNPIASTLVGENRTVKIILKADNSLMGGVRLDNFAEISDARGPNGTVVPDKDSTPDDISNNDGVAKNDEIFEDGKQGGDEDDHDIASVTITACYTITSITASDGNICVGESSMVKAISSDGSDIKWYLTPTGGTPLFTVGSNEEYKVEPTTNIVYYAELSSLSSPECPNVRLPLAIQVNARPLNPTCSESVDICTDEKINLNDYIINAVTTPGGTFEWRTGPLVTSPLVADPASVGPGKYYLFEKSGAGCFSNPSILNVKGKACDKFIDVTLRKTANKRLVTRNDVVTYTVEVKNESPGAEVAATNIRVEDVLPAGLTFVSSTNFINNSGVLVATIPIIAVNQTVLLTYEALVTGSGQIVNFAQVTAADQKDIDSSPSNGPLVNEDDDDDEVITAGGTEPQIDLSLQKIVSNSSPKLNDNLTYTIRVKNDGPDEATNVDITDVMPSSLQYVATTGGDAVTQTGGTVKVAFNTIAVGQTVQFVVVAKVIANGLISNTAEVTKADQKDKDSTPGNSIETEDDFGKVTVQVQDEVCTAVTPLIACANSYICAGESTSISAIGCNGTIVWSTGATGNLITVMPSVTTTYTAQCEVGVCLSPASNPVTVVVNSVAPPLLSATETTICAGSTSILIATGCTGSIMWSNGMVGGSIQVSPSTTTSYTAMCKVVNCESANSQPITIMVGSNTIAPTIASNLNTVCAGQSVILTATGCSGTLTWSTGATGNPITITPNVTQVYTAVCKVGSCSSPASGPLTITITPKQTPIITASKDATCGGEAVTLTTANCIGTVTWSTGATVSSITVMPIATTTYTATCGTGTCAGTASKTIIVGSGGTAPTITTSANSVCAGSAVTLTAAGCTGGAISWNTGATGNTLMVSPATTTTYTATCTIGTACTGFKTITININPKPSPPVVTCGKERICAGEELVFTGHNCDGIVTWSTGVTGKTMTVNPTVTTIYTATCTVDGCVSLPSTPVTITVIKETPTITASEETVCAGGSTVLTAANCSGTYTWSTGSNAVLITVSPVATTTYSVTCTVEGCTGMAEKTITVGTTQAQIPTTTANKMQLCEAGNVILTAANCAGTVMWSTGQTGASITVNVTATTSYTAVCKVGTCESPSSIPLTITVGKAAAPVILASGTTVCSGSSVTLTATGCTGSVIWSNGLTGNSVTVSPVAKTLYTAVCQVGINNCTSEKSNEITINVISQPNAPVISCSATRICAGDSITLAAIGCDGIVTWSTGATGRTILIRPAVTTVYTATCKIGSCTSPASAAATINVGNPVSPQIVCKNLQICSGSSTIIEARGCDGIVQWSDGQLGSVITVSPTKMTSYSAICEGGLCRSGDSNVLTVSVSGSAAKPTVKDLVNVCPNVTVDLTTGVTSTPSAGGSFIFRTGNASASPTVSDPSKVTTGTYYIFESTGTCVSAGTAINVVISDCNTTIDCTTEPAMASAGKDSTICLSGDFYTVAGSIGGAAKNSTWTTSGTGTFENSLSTTTKYFYSLADINAGFVALRITTNDPDGAGSCVAASSSMTLTINAVKTKPTIETSKSPNICFGDSVILTTKETGDFTYKWSTGATTRSIKVKSSGSYTVKLVSTSGCCSVSSVAVDVNVGPSIPTPIVTSVASNTCPATSANLATAVTGMPTSSGGRFQFHTGPTITSPILGNVSAVPAGGYYVFEKSDLGCISAPAAIKVLIDSCGATGEGNVDIAVDINGSRTEIKIGDQITYTITVENKGPGAATNVKFTNTTSNGLEFVSGANGLTSVGNTYTATIPTLAVGEKKTYTYIVRVTKAGKLPNEVEVTGLNQVDPITSNNYDKYEVECKICQETCVAMALLADTTKQVNGSYNITFTSLVENCGNVELTAVDATHNLTQMFTETGAATQSAISLVKQVSVGAGSQLIPNAGFDGKNDLTLLSKLGSKLGVGKTDTIRYTINVAPNGNIGPFSSNATVKAQGLTIFNILQDVSDVSNDGNSVAKVDATPTTVKLFNSPSISLALAITDTLKVDADCYDVTLKAVVKNSGSLVLTNVIIKDELSKSFIAPATFSLVGQPSLSIGSQLVVNTAFNGNSEPNLTTAASTLAIGKVDTVTFKLKVCPATVTRFENQASAQGTGILADGTTETPVDLSNSGLNPDTPGQTPTELIIGSNDGNSIQVPCIGLALFVDKVEIQADSSYNITYKSLIRNCGNLNLNKIALCDALINTFGSPTVSRIVGKVRVNAGSSLVPDSTFDGKSKVCLLDSTTSSIAPNKEDTVTWTVNIIPNGFFGPFKNNITVTSKSPSGQAVTDVSNDGLNSLPAGNTPTIVDLININKPVIGIAKSVKSITKVDSVANRFDVVFEFIVKNFGLNNLTNIQIQDNLAAVFGDSVSIDSVKVTAGNGLTANAAYTGKGDLINLLVSSTSTLAKNASRTVELFTRINLLNSNTTVFNNVALGIGRTDTLTVDDQSTSGLNPDPDANGNPKDNSEPTVVDVGNIILPALFTPIGVAKVASVDTTRNVDGSYRVEFSVVVKNFGTRTLTKVQLSDSLSRVFMDSSEFALIGTPTLNAGSNLRIDSSFNGNQNTNFLIADSSSLVAGASDTLTFIVKVLNKTNAEVGYSNSINGSALDSTTIVADVSQSGLVADANNDNNPGNDSQPTLFRIKGAGVSDSTVAVIIPDAISPNGDNLNDKFVITNIRESDNVSVAIYNRWGQLVYLTDNYKRDFPNENDGWDGIANQGIAVTNSGVPDGTYFYRIISDNANLFDGKPLYNFMTVAR